MTLVLCAAACSSAGGAGNDGGRNDGPSDSSAVDFSTGDSSQTSDAPVETGGAAPDGPPPGGGTGCYPACISNLRDRCLRPQSGTCSIEETGPDDVIICYANGVATRRRIVNGLMIWEFMRPDGTACYSVASSSDGKIQTYYDTDGTVAAEIELELISTSGSPRTVRCSNGEETYLSMEQVQDPRCQTLKDTDCSAGECPP